MLTRGIVTRGIVTNSQPERKTEIIFDVFDVKNIADNCTPSEISADNSACVWTNVRDFQIATMSDPRDPELKSIMAKTELVVEVGLKLAVYQGCINCGILLSGIPARGVSSEHMENMEMFSCSPT